MPESGEDPKLIPLPPCGEFCVFTFHYVPRKNSNRSFVQHLFIGKFQALWTHLLILCTTDMAEFIISPSIMRFEAR